ncbi:hypothetical protein FVA74_12905 [Salinibacterium sp. dk2585]|uniref:cation transporter dimerization domain-containing protein n=1 Tax=unclassified Salinibacterium TaxID=2632331 RepID=UPI0011C2438E|nr:MULTISPECIES: hypothetical protein [unclassified Salinibacterium]QEE62372.1 hypothetical protein FVA74_12905 [Salinibacterium sp. dk2585]TXK52745.1 hypothetical protein FVP63_12490 [Salinibacterium sp. dk5596]
MSTNGGDTASSVSKAESDAIRDAINAHPRVQSLVDLRVVRLASDELLVGASIAFPAQDRLAEIAETIEELKAAIREVAPTASGIYLEPDVYRRPDEANPPTDVYFIRGVD